MKSLLITVVIPTHNRPGSLGAAIESVQAQTHPPLEIVIVDDGSNPPVDITAFPDSPIPTRVVRNDNAQGVAAARNAGVKNAQGDFIAFLDDDDVWTPRKVEIVKSCFSAHPGTDVVFHQIGRHLPSTPTDERHRGDCIVIGDRLARMLHQHPPHLDCVVISRDLHISSPFDESFVGAEDLDYLIRLAKHPVQMVETMAMLAITGDIEVSAIGVDKRIQGRLDLLERHPEILSDSEASAHFWMRLGHQYRRNRQRLLALESFGRSFIASPNIFAARGAVLSVLPWDLQTRLTQ